MTRNIDIAIKSLPHQKTEVIETAQVNLRMLFVVIFAKNVDC